MVTPREQIAKYSTQLSYSSYASPTFLGILNEIDLVYPNTISSSDKIKWMNDAVKNVWKWCASTSLYSSTTIAGTAIYPMSTDMKFEKIKNVFVSDSTARSSTEEYVEYTQVGVDDKLNENAYYKAGNGIGLFPVPTSEYEARAIKIIYEPVPALYVSTTDTTSLPKIANDFVNIIKYGILKEVAVAGNAPDIEMQNNFESEYQELLRNMKRDYYKRMQKNHNTTWNYRSGYWRG